MPKNSERFQPSESGRAFLKLQYNWIKHLGLNAAAILAEYYSAAGRLRTKRPYRSASELSHSLNLSLRTVQRTVRYLEEKQILVPVGQSKHRVVQYEINLLKIVDNL